MPVCSPACLPYGLQGGVSTTGSSFPSFSSPLAPVRRGNRLSNRLVGIQQLYSGPHTSLFTRQAPGPVHTLTQLQGRLAWGAGLPAAQVGGSLCIKQQGVQSRFQVQPAPENYSGAKKVSQPVQESPEPAWVPGSSEPQLQPSHSIQGNGEKQCLLVERRSLAQGAEEGRSEEQREQLQ